MQPERCQPLGTLLTDAGDLAQRQGGDEGRHLLGGQHKQAIGLIQIRGDLGQEFIRCNPGRGGQLQLATNIGPDRLGHARRAPLIQGGIGNIEIGFIQRQGFNPVGVALEDGAQGGGNLLVDRHPSR